MKYICCTMALLWISLAMYSQKEWAVYDESQIPEYQLPQLMTRKNGQPVRNVKDWEKRRSELLDYFSSEMYGRTPQKKIKVRYETLEKSSDALQGKAIRKQIKAIFSANGKERSMNILIYLPRYATKPVPMFVGLNFYGNQTIYNDPAILTTETFCLNVEEKGVYNNKSSEAIRGVQSNRWCVPQLIEAGYGLATVYYGELYPDHENGKDESIASLFNENTPKEEAWQAIGAWAWGLSRIMDYLETDKDIDAKKVALMGHSRLGKAALWAGAQDQRFAIVISNDSGCGGAALFRRRIGETARIINAYFPHWFCDNFKKYNDKEEQLPVDQHELIALIAPRPVYVASAEDDLWADPKGEYLSAYHAGEAYRLYGLTPLESEEMPKVNTPIGKSVGYHIRTGGHDVTPYDWKCYLNFVEPFFKQ